MNYLNSPIFTKFGRWLSVAMICIAACTVAHAQRTQTQAQRWLFVFDLSSQMKKDLPATATALEQMFSTSAAGQLHKDDSVGIWTFDQKLHTGQVPLFEWKPDRASIITSNVIAYLKTQRYQEHTRLATLQSFMPQVVAHSERLTIVIFCDGNSRLQGTPYDDGVNQSFQDSLAERTKSRQPFVVVLRSQLGKFVNCTVAYPPGNINLPPFPKLPPPPVTHKPIAPKAAAPAATVPPLVIIGTKVGTNLNATAETQALPPATTKPQPPANLPQPASHPAPTNRTPRVSAPAASVTNPPAPKATGLKPVSVPQPVAPAKTNSASQTGSNTLAHATHSVVAAPFTLPPTNQPKPIATPTKATPTIASAASREKSGQVVARQNAPKPDQASRILIWVGIGLLAAAFALVLILILRSGRRPRGSLISSSMRDGPGRK